MSKKIYSRILKSISRIIKKKTYALLDEKYKYVFLSDMHLGCADNADETVQTEHLIKYALQKYLNEDYRVVMLGDTFELAETHDIRKIKNAHSEVMDLFKKLYERGQLFIVKGNHDAYLSVSDLETRFDQKKGEYVSFLDGIELYDAVHIGEVWAMHGHQNRWMYTSWFNKVLITLGSVWSSWQKHHSDFHSKESTGWQARAEFDKEWDLLAKSENAFYIVGHSHECFMTDNYANSGTSGVMQKRITATELLDNGELIKNIEFKEVIDTNGYVKVVKNVLDRTTFKI